MHFEMFCFLQICLGLLVGCLISAEPDSNIDEFEQKHNHHHHHYHNEQIIKEGNHLTGEALREYAALHRARMDHLREVYEHRGDVQMGNPVPPSKSAEPSMSVTNTIDYLINRSQHQRSSSAYSGFLRHHLYNTVPIFDVQKIFKFSYVFGYSTGHCGTTAFADRYVFGNSTRQQQIYFEHEMSSTRLTVRDYRVFNSTDEYEYVRRLYFKTIHKTLTDKDSIVTNPAVFYDNGHHNLYYMNGLLAYLSELQRDYPNEFKYHMLRIRRNRVETALSLTFQGSGMSDPDHLRSRWNPFERLGDVIYTVRRIDWFQFTYFQKALWMVDETEARWLRHKKEFPNLKYTEIYWESSKFSDSVKGNKFVNSSFEYAVETIARVLEIDPHTLTFNVTWKHEHVTAEYKETLANLTRSLFHQMQDYISVMNKSGHSIDFSYLPSTYNKYPGLIE